MRAIAVLLLLVASVAAQEMKGILRLNDNYEGREFELGRLTLTQPGPEGKIKITGTLRGLEPGGYIAMMHEKQTFTGNCDSLGVIEKLNLAGFENEDLLFTFFYMRVQSKSFERIEETSYQGTLQMDKSASLVGRTIALYDASTFNQTSNTPAVRSVACGIVEPAVGPEDTIDESTDY